MSEHGTIWHRVSDDSEGLEWGGNGIAVSEAGGRRFCIVRVGGILRAFAATCPHAGASLAEGWFDTRGHLVCPLHKYRFDVCNGRNVSGEGFHLRTFPLRVDGGCVEVGLPSVDPIGGSAEG